jgi:hypothetical protein
MVYLSGSGKRQLDYRDNQRWSTTDACLIYQASAPNAHFTPRGTLAGTMTVPAVTLQGAAQHIRPADRGPQFTGGYQI